MTKIAIKFTYILTTILLATLFCNRSQKCFGAINQTLQQMVPMPSDSRIKIFIYNPNEIFQLKLHPKILSTIELQKNEHVELMAFGDATFWDVKVMDEKIFLKPLQYGVKTNLNIYTDKRTYSMELSSDVDETEGDERFVYRLMFYYPEQNIVDISPTTTKLAKIALNKRIAAHTRNTNTLQEGVLANAGMLNTNYTYSTKGEVQNIIPMMIFDNGSKTYLKFKEIDNFPTISAVTDDYKEIPLRVKKNGEYVYVDTVEKQLTIRDNDNIVCIFNESIKKNNKSVAFVNES